MNKKLKLILSCFCLCLTLGIMSVAVWAATTTNYTLSNTISYQIEDVYVRVQTKLYKKSTAGMVSNEDLISQCEALEGKKHSEITGVTLVETYDEFKTYDGKSAINPSTTGCDCDIAYDTSAQNPAFAYYVVMEIENYASDPIHAYLLNNTTADINSYTYFTSDLVELNGTTTTSVVIGFALKDSTVALSEVDAPFDLKINAGEYNPEDFMTFTEVTDDSGAVTGYSVSAKDTSIAGPFAIPNTYNNLPVSGIDYEAFYECSNITSVEIPSSMTIIEDYAFYGCTSLVNMSISEGCVSIGKYAFSECSNLTEISIPSTVKNIKIHAFSHCSSLSGVTIQNGLQSLANYTFYECSSLKKIVIPSSVTSIEPYTFSSCTSLTDVTIPNSVTSIKASAFSKCSSLAEITIPNSVTAIVYNAFSDCSSLKSITVEENNEVFHSAGNCIIETASRTLIIGCKSSIIPSDGSVTRIGQQAFYNCKGLTTITIPDTITSIGTSVFYWCSNLTSIIIEGATSTNWGYANSETATNWTSIDLTNATTNATYFKTTYDDKYFKKIG